MVPACGEPMVAFGLPKWAVLVKLKNSPRNSKRVFSDSRKLRANEEVEIYQARRAQHVASRIAISECRRHGKRQRIKPAIHVAFTAREIAVAQPIRAHRIGRVGRIACDIGIDRLTGLRDEDAADLEPTEHGPRES